MKKIFLLVIVLVLSLVCTTFVFGFQKKAYTTPKQSFKLSFKGAKKWTSSRITVASVNKGKVKSLKKGTAKITCKVGNKKYKCALKVYSKKKMYNKLNGVYKKIEKQKTTGYESKSQLSRSIKALKKVKNTGKTFFKKIVGKRYKKVKKAYNLFQRMVKKELKDKKLLLKEWDIKEDGEHTDYFYQIESNVMDDEWLSWAALVKYYGETFSLYAV